jgi:nitroimidazol reductase NimA-like FMN-containing flavoprotein (pyridoxamine 5'-phosphate oxidase superfamily)
MDANAGVDHNGMQALGTAECMRRLGRAGVGRIAVTVGALPAIFPVNYAMHDDEIYFRTASGTKLAAASDKAVVAFEIDNANAIWHDGWSVLVVGRAEEVVDPDALDRLRDLPLRPWLPSGPMTLVRIRPRIISGRQITHVPLAPRGPVVPDRLVTACPRCGITD